MQAAKKTTSKKVVKVHGVILDPGYAGSVHWRVRLIAPHFPFFIDSGTYFQRKEDAEAMAARWRKRKIVITITN
jgi:hypothetical protein